MKIRPRPTRFSRLKYFAWDIQSRFLSGQVFLRITIYFAMFLKAFQDCDHEILYPANRKKAVSNHFSDNNIPLR